MLRDLVLFRHGKAAHPDAAPDDFSRPLTERGHREAATQARRLSDAGFAPNVVLVSTAVRASQTWDEAAPYFPDASFTRTRTLYLAAPEVYLRAAKDAALPSVMVIAHDPGLHDLACDLLAGDREALRSREGRALADHLPTAGIAWFKRTAADAPWKMHLHLRPGRLEA